MFFVFLLLVSRLLCLLSLYIPPSTFLFRTFEQLGVRAVGAEAARDLSFGAGHLFFPFFVGQSSSFLFSRRRSMLFSLLSLNTLPLPLSLSLRRYFALLPLLYRSLLLCSLLAVGQGVQHERRGPHGAAKGGEQKEIGLELFGRGGGVGPARGEHRLRGEGRVRWCEGDAEA